MESSNEPGGRVLVVEDEESVRIALEGILFEQFDVTSVGTLVEARAALQQGDFDVILSDHELPDGTGLDFLKWAGEEYPDVMGIMVTGHHDLPELRRAEENKTLVRLLKKPYDPARLISLVHNTVQLARLRQAMNQLGKRLGAVR